MNGENVNALLERLGLTEYESKTLSTLFSLGEAEAPNISRLAQVPKTRVYDVLNKLVEKNMVIEIRGRPKRYRSIAPEKALDTLVKSKHQELSDLQEKVDSVKETVAFGGKTRQRGEETVMRVKDRHDFERILAQEIEGAKKNLVGFAEVTDKEHALKEAIAKARERNVTVKLLNSFSADWLKKEASEAKQAEHGLNAFIVDGKKVILALSDFKQDKQDYHFTIFPEHKPMANALQHYFDKMWEKAKKP